MTNFHELYKRYSKDVFRFAFYLCGSTADAEDITSETFMRVWIVKNKLKIETVKAYLLTIARNIFLQSQRKNNNTLEINENMKDPNPDPDKIVETQSELQQVLQFIQKLPELDRTVLIMRAQNGLSYQEIAHSTGLSLSAVKVKIHRARILLNSMRSTEENINEDYS